MDSLLLLLIGIIAVAVFAQLAVLFGVDSREDLGVPQTTVLR